MNFGQAIRSAFSQYASFRGRATRSEYWFFWLFRVIVGNVVLFPLTEALDLAIYIPISLDETYAINIPNLLWNLAIFLPSLALSVRRLHDIDKSGWVILCGFVPIIGQIILLVFYQRDSQPGQNQYGVSLKYPNPPQPNGGWYPQGQYQQIPYPQNQYAQLQYNQQYQYRQPQYTQQYQQPQSKATAPQNRAPKNPAAGDFGGICLSCGARRVENSRFCTSCGALFDK